MRNVIMIVAHIAIANVLLAQNTRFSYGDNIPNPKSPIREADVMWMNTVWQRIDLHEKFNQGFYFPTEPGDQNRYSLFDYLKKSLLNDPSFRAFDPGVVGDDDMFRKPMTKKQLENLFISEEIVLTERLDMPGVWDSIPVTTELSTENVLAYEIKEQWFFDKQRSVMDVRILGICPIMRIYDSQTGEFRGEKRLFWVYLPEATSEMASWSYFNPRNEYDHLTYDDIFVKRKFQSYIIKTSNVYDRYIFEYAKGKDALIEAEMEKMKLFNMEHDLWSF